MYVPTPETDCVECPPTRNHASRVAGSGELGLRFDLGAAGVLDHGAVEELRVGAGVEANRVREHEGAEVVVVEELALDELVRLLEHGGDVGYVPVADVGAEDRAELDSEGVDAGVERERVGRVVGLAAEEEVRHEALDEILGRVDAGGP